MEHYLKLQVIWLLLGPCGVRSGTADKVERLLHPIEPSVPGFGQIDDHSNAEAQIEQALWVDECAKLLSESEIHQLNSFYCLTFIVLVRCNAVFQIQAIIEHFSKTAETVAPACSLEHGQLYDRERPKSPNALRRTVL
jgi:hypothetical protein